MLIRFFIVKICKKITRTNEINRNPGITFISYRERISRIPLILVNFLTFDEKVDINVSRKNILTGFLW